MTNKTYIMRMCAKFTKDQNLKVLKCIQDMDIPISEGADGARINLDKLSKKQLAILKKAIKKIDIPIPLQHQIE